MNTKEELKALALFMLQKIESMHDDLPEGSMFKDTLYTDICILIEALKELDKGCIEDTYDLEAYLENEYEKMKD